MCIVRWRRNDDYVNVKNRFSIIKKRVADGNPFPTGDTPILIKQTLFGCKGNVFLSDMQMLDCIIVFVLEELTLSLYELHNYWRYRLHWYTFGEFDCKLTIPL